MAKVPNGKETLPKISTSISTLQTTNRQTTDGRAIAYSERERGFTFTFAKNWSGPVYNQV